MDVKDHTPLSFTVAFLGALGGEKGTSLQATLHW